MGKYYDIVKPTRKTPKAVLISKTGAIYNIGDAITITDEQGRQSQEVVIAMFSFDKFGELYFHTLTAIEHRTPAFHLENATNKTQEYLDKAKKMIG